MKNRKIDVPKEVNDYLSKIIQKREDSKNEYDLFNTATMVQSMRNSAYKNIGEAISDIIDNSIEAKARRIDIITKTDSKQRVVAVGILDNGHGMVKEMIEEAIRWGGGHKHDLVKEQSDSSSKRTIGRFGAALPTTSAYATKKTRVFSKTNESKCHELVFDIVKIVDLDRKNKRYVPEAKPSKLPDWVEAFKEKNYKANDKTGSHTLVLWENPDKIWGYTKEQTFNEKIIRRLGYTFKNHLSIQVGVKMFVNGRKVDMIDPLFITPEARGYDGGNGVFAEEIPSQELEYTHEIGEDSMGKKIKRKGKIRVRMSYLPFGEQTDPSFQRDFNGSLIKQRFNVMKENRGYFIICREGRQICNYGLSPKDLGYDKESWRISLRNFDRQWNIELDFDAELDELFNVTYLKNEVIIHEMLWKWFVDKLEPNFPTLISRWRKRTDKASRERAALKEETKYGERLRPSEVIMEDTDKFNPITPSQLMREKGKKELERLAQKLVQENRYNSKEEAVKDLKGKYSRPKFKVEFTSKGEHELFYEKAYIHQQTLLLINKGHRFFTEIYLQCNDRERLALEILLFTLIKAEFRAETIYEDNPDLYDFYQSEKKVWSKNLETYLRRFSLKNPPSDIDRESVKSI